MADFLFDFKNETKLKCSYDKRYSEQSQMVNGLTISHNGNILLINDADRTLCLTGTAYVIGKDLKEYLTSLLRNFDESSIVSVKKELVGQYSLLLTISDTLYMFSDFLQIRSIYYSTDNMLVSSSFETLYNILGNNVRYRDNYKFYEFFAMKHCYYASWFGNGTIDTRINRLRGFEYLKYNLSDGSMSVKPLVFQINNVKVKDRASLTKQTLETLQSVIYQSAYKDKKIAMSITGGFDSRMITSIAKQYYKSGRLRVAAYTNEDNIDYSYSRKISKAVKLPLDVYETDKTAVDSFYDYTDGLAPKGNTIITNLIENTSKYALGFGGTFGSELYSTLPFFSIDQIHRAYVQCADKYVTGGGENVKMFSDAILREFEEIKAHYMLDEYDERDLIRIFLLKITSSFSSPLISSFNIFGNQFEPIPTYPVVEAGLRIPYEYQGGADTFGRLYMIPKSVVSVADKKLSRMMTIHQCPMAPLSISTAMQYIVGGVVRRCQEYSASHHHVEVKSISVEMAGWKYNSDGWNEGFIKKYVNPS